MAVTCPVSPSWSLAVWGTTLGSLLLFLHRWLGTVPEVGKDYERAEKTA